jgi:alanyl-tRNA synthetase
MLGVAQIVSEFSVAAGVRRIEIVAGRAALQAIRARTEALQSIAASLETVPDLAVERVSSTVEELGASRKEIAKLRSRLAKGEAEAMLSTAVEVDGARVLSAAVDAPSMDAMREMVDWLRPRLEPGVIVLGAVINDRPNFVASVSKSLITPGFDAVKLVKQVASHTGGGGGGRPEMAQAGGKDAGQMRRALDGVAGAVAEGLRRK